MTDKELIWKKLKHDVGSFHDCVYEVNQVSHTDDELRDIFLSLPDDMIGTAYSWGLSDTVFRDSVYVYLREG